MNIAFITPRFILGGYEKVVISYANAFADLGHHITILCGFKEGELLSQIQENVEVVELKARIRNFTLPLAKYLKNNPTDILYAPFRTYTSVAVIARKLSGNKDCVIYGSAHGYGKGKRMSNWISGRIMRHADILTAVTRELAEYESMELHIPISKYRVFNNPVVDDSKGIKPEKHKWLGKNKIVPVIAVSGRLEADKGEKKAILMFAEVCKYTEARMIVMGEGSERANLEQLVCDLNIQDKTDFLGFVKNPMGYLSQCDVLLHPAEIEAFGNVIVEALFCNVPVVTTDCKGPVEIIENGKYGINIGNYHSEDVIQKGAEAVLDILTGKRRFSGMREKALEFDAKYVEKDFVGHWFKIKNPVLENGRQVDRKTTYSNENKLISVIVPIYNGVKFIDGCVESICSQGYKNLEIILVDDGSTDDSLERCQEWAQRDLRIRVLHKVNGGQFSARNMAMNTANGDYVSFVDQDDRLNNHFYEELVAALEVTGCDIARCEDAVYEYGGLHVPKYICTQNTIYDRKYRQLVLEDRFTNHVTNRLFKREKIGSVRFPQSKTIEDMGFMRELVMVYDLTEVYIPKGLYIYNNRQDNTSNISGRTYLNSYERAIEFQKRYVLARSICPEAQDRTLQQASFFSCSSWYKLKRYKIHDEGKVKEMRGFLKKNKKEIMKNHQIPFKIKAMTMVLGI